ncbi:MAG: hypothetical protein RBT71_11540 [Flavobacteriales bacterium]|jgi:hypothetical protein|nr:hypothetical protein [Flavobacteriales bacterium]
MRLIAALLTGAALLLGGCSGAPPDRDPSTDPHAGSQAGLPAGQEGLPAGQAGPPWEVNAATREGVQAMRRLVEGYPANALRNGALKDSLETQLTLIFERCTMQGEAHERLHDFLLPLYQLYRELPPDPGPEQVAAIRTHLESFGKEFR